MANYSNENITKVVKLSHREFPHLVQNRKSICTRNIWCIQYNADQLDLNFNKVQKILRLHQIL